MNNLALSIWLDISLQVNRRGYNPLFEDRAIEKSYWNRRIEREVNSIVNHNSHELIKTGLSKSKIFK